MATNPYDELPYRASSIEWSAPERLSLASLLHGGPRVDLQAYRLLELGCADGTNLLPLAWYRRHGSFVGVDSAHTQIACAERRASQLGLDNATFIHADFATLDETLDGEFSFIIAHGVFSWISDASRHALLKLCAHRLRAGGLLYFNYNAKPGWEVRGMVRDFVRAQTSSIEGLRAQVRAAQEVCGRLVDSMGEHDEHPYRRLLANEFRLLRDAEASYVAHEYLTPDNHAYWVGELLELLAEYGLAYVADADYSYPWAREDPGFTAWLRDENIVGQGVHDTIDLLRYRQLRSPIFTKAPLSLRAPEASEFGELHIASCLSPRGDIFDHPSGYEVRVDDEKLHQALLELRPRWPRGLPVHELFTDLPAVLDDLQVLQRNGLIELRLDEARAYEVSGEFLNRLETEWDLHRTTPLHTREPTTEGW